MLTRRALLFTGGLLARFRPADAAALQAATNGPPDGQDTHEIRDAIKALGQRATPSAEVLEIRTKQRTHFKVNQKLPDYIDVGITVWERLHEWHLQNNLPLKTARADDGHALMELMLTTVILKSELPDAQIGVPYDK